MWGWGRPKRDIPQVNYTESDSEEDFETGLSFDHLTSPQRPLTTRQGSPLNNVEGGPTLADNVDDLLEEAQYKLHDIAVVREELEELTDLLEVVDTRVGGDSEVSSNTTESQVVGEELVESGLVAEN